MISVKTVTRAGKNGMTMAQLQKGFARVRKSYVKAGVLGATGTHTPGTVVRKVEARRDPHSGRFRKAVQARTDANGAVSELTNAVLAAIHEYGLGTAPARPWIGPPFRAKRPEYFRTLAAAYRTALRAGKPQDVDKVLGLLGAQMAADIKNYVTSGAGVPPPNAPSTIRQKGSSRPLVDTSGMVNSVTYQVVSGGR